MILFPKKYKFIKPFSGKKLSLVEKHNIPLLRFGNLAIVAKENGKVTNFQLEALRRYLRRTLKKKAQIFFRLFPHIAITKKPNEIRQGRGKGGLKY